MLPTLAAILLAASPAADYDAAWADYATLPATEATYYRYLTTAALPAELNEHAPQVLGLVANTLSSKRLARRPVQVSPTLYRVDLRDYGWTADAWFRLSRRDRYYNNAATLILRADWFVREVTDSTLGPAYYDFLYGVGKAPKNVAEFQRAWAVQLADLERFDLPTGAIVEDGQSIVVQHNRITFRGPTILGSYHETYDFDSSTGEDDVVKNLLRRTSDAGEHIATLPNGLQAYLLSNAKRDRIEFADQELIARQRVHTAIDCMTCHGTVNGWHPPRNALVELIDDGVDLRTASKELKDAIEAYYLTDNGQLMAGDQRNYEAAVVRASGARPAEVTAWLADLIRWYEQPVTIEQAAIETSCDVETFRQRVSATAEGRLAWLLRGRAVPRESWERDYYLQARTLVRGK